MQVDVPNFIRRIALRSYLVCVQITGGNNSPKWTAFSDYICMEEMAAWGLRSNIMASTSGNINSRHLLTLPPPICTPRTKIQLINRLWRKMHIYSLSSLFTYFYYSYLVCLKILFFLKIKLLYDFDIRCMCPRESKARALLLRAPYIQSVVLWPKCFRH